MCGLIGVWVGKKERHLPNVAKMAYLGLYALQHRGQESAGITIASPDKRLISFKDKGLVQEKENIQPIVIDYYNGKLALAHNGNLKNANYLRQKLTSEGVAFRASSDSEIIAQLLAKESSSFSLLHIEKKLLLIEILKEISGLLQGAYTLLLLTLDSIIALRDPLGFRPLFWGTKDNLHFFASESCALDLLGAETYYELQPGELIEITKEGEVIKAEINNGKKQMNLPWVKDEGDTHKLYQCIFEFIYFARPDSTIFGENVYSIRHLCGSKLFKERPTKADVVIPIPDSGVPAALGYALEAGLPYELGLMRNHYIGRTFINPRQAVREFGVEIKLNPLPKIIKDKRVILVDDSIVRGTTCKKIIKLVKKAGAKEIHLRIASPPIKYPCFFGIDTPKRQELIASSLTPIKIRQFLGVNSLHYLSLKGLLSCLGENSSKLFCTACFDGNYPY
jgi:amidophosphoribosyltransferase